MYKRSNRRQQTTTVTNQAYRQQCLQYITTKARYTQLQHRHTFHNKVAWQRFRLQPKAICPRRHKKRSTTIKNHAWVQHTVPPRRCQQDMQEPNIKQSNTVQQGLTMPPIGPMRHIRDHIQPSNTHISTRVQPTHRRFRLFRRLQTVPTYKGVRSAASRVRSKEHTTRAMQRQQRHTQLSSCKEPLFNNVNSSSTQSRQQGMSSQHKQQRGRRHHTTRSGTISKTTKEHIQLNTQPT